MALQINYTTEHGIDIINAYMRINNIKLQSPVKLSNVPILHVEVELYASNQARTDGKTPVGIIAINGEYDTSTLIVNNSFTEICYDWIKTQPGFESAVNV